MTAATPENVVDEGDLIAAGYRPLEIRWSTTGHDIAAYGRCVEFDVPGEVPPVAGLYLFTVDRVDGVEVRYVGMTTHLWMVTKGCLPGGRARGGQRYGRPRHAGETRKRVNAALSSDAELGQRVRQWLRVVSDLEGDSTALRAAEETDICRWHTRRLGLNRG